MALLWPGVATHPDAPVCAALALAPNLRDLWGQHQEGGTMILHYVFALLAFCVSFATAQVSLQSRTIRLNVDPLTEANRVDLAATSRLRFAILSDVDTEPAQAFRPAETVIRQTVRVQAPVLQARTVAICPFGEERDVNGDGVLDVLCHVPIDALRLTCADDELVVDGETASGFLISGRDAIQVLGCPTGSPRRQR
jgi:hypothetical protein